MSVVDTSPPAWYTYYPRPVSGAAHPRDAPSMREKPLNPRKMAVVPAVAPCVSPKPGSVYPTSYHHHRHQQQQHQQHQQQQHHHHSYHHNQRRNHRDGENDSADDNMMPFDLSRHGGSSPSTSPRSPHRSQRMSPAAFKPYDGGSAANNNDQPLDLRVEHKKWHGQDENQNIIEERTPSPEDIEVDSPGPPSSQYQLPPPHHDRELRCGVGVHSPAGSSDKDVVVTDDDQHSQRRHGVHQRRGGMTVDGERHRPPPMVNYPPVIFPPHQLHPMIVEAMYRPNRYQHAGAGAGYHRSSHHYPSFMNSSLLNGHHHVPPPTYDVQVRPPPPTPVTRSPQQKSSSFQETSGKPKDR